jgi:rhomboid protease GluP
MSENFLWRLHQLTPRTYATWLFIAINVIVWLLNIAGGMSAFAPAPRQLLVWGGNYVPLTLEQPWRLITAMFLHGGVFHLGVNMWSLHDTGRVAERFYGTSQFAAIYLISGLFGSLASCFFAARGGVAIGASGAIFGVVGCLFAALFTKSDKLPPSLVSGLKRSMIPFTLLSLYLGFTTAHVDNAAHVGGLLSGFALGVIMAEKFDETAFRRTAVMRATIALVGALILGLMIWSFVPRR